jgi:hypothetical protein
VIPTTVICSDCPGDVGHSTMVPRGCGIDLRRQPGARLASHVAFGDLVAVQLAVRVARRHTTVRQMHSQRNTESDSDSGTLVAGRGVRASEGVRGEQQAGFRGQRLLPYHGSDVGDRPGLLHG